MYTDHAVSSSSSRLIQLMYNEHSGQHLMKFSDRQQTVTITVKHFETDYNNSRGSGISFIQGAKIASKNLLNILIDYARGSINKTQKYRNASKKLQIKNVLKPQKS